MTGTVGHTFQRTAILKLSKLVACPLAPDCDTVSQGGGAELGAFSKYVGGLTIVTHLLEFIRYQFS